MTRLFKSPEPAPGIGQANDAKHVSVRPFPHAQNPAGSLVWHCFGICGKTCANICATRIPPAPCVKHLTKFKSWELLTPQSCCTQHTTTRTKMLNTAEQPTCTPLEQARNLTQPTSTQGPWTVRGKPSYKSATVSLNNPPPLKRTNHRFHQHASVISASVCAVVICVA